MAFPFPDVFLIAADLTLASALSCFLYALVCSCLAGVTGFAFFYSSFRMAKKMKRKGRTMILASRNSIGQKLSKILNHSDFGGLDVCQPPEGKQASIHKKCSSPIKATPVLEAKEKYQKEMQSHIGSHLSLKGVSGAAKKPSAMRWKEEREFGKTNTYERKQKNYRVTPAFLIALLCVPPKLACHFLKNRSLQLLTTLMKFQD